MVKLMNSQGTFSNLVDRHRTNPSNTMETPLRYFSIVGNVFPIWTPDADTIVYDGEISEFTCECFPGAGLYHVTHIRVRGPINTTSVIQEYFWKQLIEGLLFIAAQI